MAPLLEQAKMQENENDNESGAGNGRGNHSGGELAGSEFQFTFSQPSVVADACAEANAGRKIANLGREWQQRAALARLEGEGLQAPPMTALNKEERAVRRERFLRKAICILHEQLRRKTQLGESLEKLARAQTLELSLSSKERLQVGGEGEGEETMESLLDNLDGKLRHISRPPHYRFFIDIRQPRQSHPHPRHHITNPWPRVTRRSRTSKTKWPS